MSGALCVLTPFLPLANGEARNMAFPFTDEEVESE